MNSKFCSENALGFIRLAPESALMNIRARKCLKCIDSMFLPPKSSVVLRSPHLNTKPAFFQHIQRKRKHLHETFSLFFHKVLFLFL